MASGEGSRHRGMVLVDGDNGAEAALRLPVRAKVATTRLDCWGVRRFENGGFGEGAMAGFSRRRFVVGMGAAAAVAGRSYGAQAACRSPFRLAVISDEVSQDFDHACAVISGEFGFAWVELRAMWGKNLVGMGDADLAKAEAILSKYRLRVTDIASPLLKVDWPDAPKSTYSPKTDTFGASYGFKQQGEVLERCIALAKRFRTNKVRGFDFWRLDDQGPYREAIDAKLLETAEACGRHGVMFVLENEYECNTATGREAARTLGTVKSPTMKLNWDPANAVARGEVDAWPGGWNALPKERIAHCHVKDAVRTGADGFAWEAVGKGVIDWTAQFRALRRMGYHQGVSLETHWKGGGTPEDSSRASLAGMKRALEQAGTLAQS